ncbi:MAG: DNA starvation/stationary phase protection protein [Alphaproteobacteria bacterium GM202ARS2]|nr:DNA starvation/stationary phase protection protein [Alphaproteobacteria bacterium GM202ARS2]
MNTPTLPDALRALLADSMTLYLKSLTFHWNVEGEHFDTLHALFEKHYRALIDANDEIAERLRAMGHYVPVSYDTLKAQSALRLPEKNPDATTMIRQLADDHHHIAHESCSLVFKQAEKEGDIVSADLATRRADFHEKTHWMLTSLLKKGS